MLAQLAVLDSLPVPKDHVPEPVPVKQKQKQNVAQVAQVAQLTHGQNALHKMKPVPIKKGGILWSCFFFFLNLCHLCHSFYCYEKTGCYRWHKVSLAQGASCASNETGASQMSTVKTPPAVMRLGENKPSCSSVKPSSVPLKPPPVFKPEVLTDQQNRHTVEQQCKVSRNQPLKPPEVLIPATARPASSLAAVLPADDDSNEVSLGTVASLQVHAASTPRLADRLAAKEAETFCLTAAAEQAPDGGSKPTGKPAPLKVSETQRRAGQSR